MSRVQHDVRQASRLGNWSGVPLVLALSVFVLGASDSAGADSAGTVLARLSAPSPVSAYDGFLAWSDLNASTGRYTLMLRRPSGGVERASIPGQRVPFDVDLGPGPDGSPWAVFSRCARAPRARHLGGLPDYATGTRCRIHALPLNGGDERLLDTRPARSAFAPTIWRHTLVFAGTLRTAGQQRIYERQIGSTRPATRRRGGPSRRGEGALLGQDLRGATLAFTWGYSLPPGGSFPGDDRLVWDVRLDRPGQPQRLLGRITLGPESTPRVFTNPSIARGKVTFASSAFPGSSHNSLTSYGVHTGRRTTIRLESPTAAVATDGGVTYRVQTSAGPGFSARGACGNSTNSVRGCFLVAGPP